MYFARMNKSDKNVQHVRCITQRYCYCGIVELYCAKPTNVLQRVMKALAFCQKKRPPKNMWKNGKKPNQRSEIELTASKWIVYNSCSRMVQPDNVSTGQCWLFSMRSRRWRSDFPLAIKCRKNRLRSQTAHSENISKIWYQTN